MSRLGETFGQVAKQGRAALVAYLTAGDPDLPKSEALILALAEAGVDIFELGIPFSDPFADGVAIQEAMVRARQAGATLAAVFALTARLRARIPQPIVLFGYYNPIFVHGEAAFAKSAAEAGADGLLVVDLPPEEGTSLASELKKQALDLIPLLAPTSTPGRVTAAKSVASGFVYYVSMTGITGAKLDDLGSVAENVTRLKREISLPIAVGFGIKEVSQAQAVAQVADGVVVGSALIAEMQKGGPSAAAALARSLAGVMARR